MGSYEAFKINQNDYNIIIFSIPANKLIEISFFNPREIDRESGIQRKHVEMKSKNIADDIDNNNCTLPNNIIINFNLIVSAYFNLSLTDIAEIFFQINYHQKPVNKFLVFDLLGISEKIFPQYYLLHNVVKKLNEEINSPFYNQIKMLGSGDEINLLDKIKNVLNLKASLNDYGIVYYPKKNTT